VTAHTDGTPMMRPLVFDFPEDPACTHLDRQYLLGDSLLVAPVFSADGDTTYYVPAGRWTRFDTGSTVDGPAWVRETHGFDSVPLLVRPGSVLPVGGRDDRPDYDYADAVTLRLYQIADGQRVTTIVPDLNGDERGRFTVRRDGRRLSVERCGPSAPWRILLVGHSSVASVSTGSLTSTDQGCRIDVEAGADVCEVSLAAGS
jgi:alpha-D-xyloside xylohydrolase